MFILWEDGGLSGPFWKNRYAKLYLRTLIQELLQWISGYNERAGGYAHRNSTTASTHQHKQKLGTA